LGRDWPQNKHLHFSASGLSHHHPRWKDPRVVADKGIPWSKQVREVRKDCVLDISVSREAHQTTGIPRSSWALSNRFFRKVEIEFF
jgi:hypothetical protein